MKYNEQQLNTERWVTVDGRNAKIVHIIGTRYRCSMDIHPGYFDEQRIPRWGYDP